MIRALGVAAALVVAAAVPAVPAVAASVPAAPTAAGAGPGQPVVVGNQLEDARTGDTWVPHGVNWPDLEYSCVQGWTPEHPASETQKMADWGIDVVRIPLNEDCWLGVEGAPHSVDGHPFTAADYQAEVAERVQAVNAAGMVAILDLHWSAPPRYPADGQHPMADLQSLAFWQGVAAAYHSNPSVMFELFNEPYEFQGSWHGLSWDCWENGGCTAPAGGQDNPDITDTYTVAGMAQLVAAVRSTGAAQPLLLGGLDYANDLSGWLAHKPDDDQLVAAWHDYYGQGCWTTCWNTTITSVAAQVPVLMTEFGWDSDHTSAVEQAMDWADAHGMGYLPWAWWVTTPEDGREAQDYALVTSSYSPKAPEGTVYHDHLAELLHPVRTLVTAMPTVTGSGAPGAKLAAHPGSWTSGTAFAYQWLRDGFPIPNATSSTYVVQTADARSRLSVRVTGSKAGYTTASRTSAAIAIAATPAPPRPGPAGSGGRSGTLPGRPPSHRP